ncbi:MAG: ATP-binding protein, partial [Bdellovibrionota bacterium]
MNSSATKILAEVQASFAALPNGARRFLAVSGGIDSMVLLEAVFRLKVSNAVVVHVNHGLRGAESDADEALVRKAAQERNFLFFSTTLNWQDAKPSQASCRQRREEFFSSLMETGEKIFL